MSNILIVGGAGYVGGAVTDLLVGGEHSIRVFDNILYEDSYRKPVDFVYGDVRDTATLAHELGHAVHSMLAEEHSVLTQHASLPLAETASVSRRTAAGRPSPGAAWTGKTGR